MGYYIRNLKWKKKPPTWKLQFVSYKEKDQRSVNAKMPKTTWDIPKERWRGLGFYPGMNINEARARSKQLNAQLLLRYQEERIRKFQQKERKFQLRHDAVLPDEFVREFEERFVRPRGLDFISQGKRRAYIGRRYTMWRAAERMITTLSIEPSDWFFHTADIYDYFYQRQYSLGYIQGIIKFSNLWGHFISRKLCKPFLPILMPKGYERQRIIEAFYKKERPKKPSQPITPKHLELIRGKINLANFNWLYISVWLGLRPQEIDNIHDKELWYVETLPTGRKILWIFQTKIIALPPEDRWKPIPILFDEQQFAVKIINDRTHKRPLTKTVRKYFGKGIDLYGGRKGFVDLMLSLGQSLENISIWMGHSSLSRTWRNYKNKRVFHL